MGFVAIQEDHQLMGYNVLVGGGMGMTFGNEETYPRLANDIGFIPPEMVVQVAEEIVKIQRDNGNRSDRKTARLKYTIDRLGLNWFVDELQKRLNYGIPALTPVSVSIRMPTGMAG